MPVFVYVLLGIALLIILLLSLRIRVIISYDDSLKVYAKILFFKYDIIPQKDKQKKDKKKKKKPASPPSQSAEQKPKSQPKKKDSIVTKLWNMRAMLLSIIDKFLGKLRFKFIKLRATIACDDACKTALAYASVNQGIAYIIEILRNVSNVEVSKRADIMVKSDFISQESEFEGKIELYIRVLPIISVGIHALKEFIKFKNNTED